ncbi:unnamed protein product [Ectocarpus sp. CCAP 1310/34]|nr:unnamed protein product [Ectocarpus sp. CCAP 1310/34]
MDPSVQNAVQAKIAADAAAAEAAPAYDGAAPNAAAPNAAAADAAAAVNAAAAAVAAADAAAAAAAPPAAVHNGGDAPPANNGPEEGAGANPLGGIQAMLTQFMNAHQAQMAALHQQVAQQGQILQQQQQQQQQQQLVPDGVTCEGVPWHVVE